MTQVYLKSYVLSRDTRQELIILSDFLPLTTRNDQFIRVYRESFYAMWDKAVKLKTNDIVDRKRIQVILAPTPKPLEIPADLEECVKNCLKAHERIKNRAQELNA